MFKPIKNTSISKKVIEQIKGMLYEGILKKGDKLPSERQMAEGLAISRSSVREALKELEIMGLIESRPGEGNFVKENFEDILYEPFSTIFLLKESNPEEIIELRKVIEQGCAALAGMRINEEDLLEIEEILRESDLSEDEEELSQLDVRFHYKIAQASKNFLLQSILNAVSGLIEEFIKDIRTNILTEKEHKDNIKKQHWIIYEMLSLNDPKKAEEAMTFHLDYVNCQMKKSMDNKGD